MKMADESFVVLPMHSPQSKEIAKVMANETARQIMAKLALKTCSSSEISQELHLPLSTVEYNLNALEKVGLIKPKSYKWSKKGRKIQFFSPTKKLIIIAPEERAAGISDVIQKNLQHLFMILIAVSAIATGFYFPRGEILASQVAVGASREGVAAAGAPVTDMVAGELLRGAATGAFYASVIILIISVILYFVSRKLKTSK